LHEDPAQNIGPFQRAGILQTPGILMLSRRWVLVTQQKLLDRFVAIGAFAAKQVCFLGVDPQGGDPWDHRNVFAQFSFVHQIPFKTGLLQLHKAFQHTTDHSMQILRGVNVAANPNQAFIMAKLGMKTS